MPYLAATLSRMGARSRSSANRDGSARVTTVSADTADEAKGLLFERSCMKGCAPAHSRSSARQRKSRYRCCEAGTLLALERFRTLFPKARINGPSRLCWVRCRFVHDRRLYSSGAQGVAHTRHTGHLAQDVFGAGNRALRPSSAPTTGVITCLNLHCRIRAACQRRK